MKLVLLTILVISRLCISKHRQRRSMVHYGIARGSNEQQDPFLKVKEYNERKVGMFARVNVDPNMRAMMNIEGLTTNYSQMLMNPNSYMILRKNPLQKLDISKKIVIGLKPTQRSLGYSYGEVDQEHQYDKDQYQFTNNYKEMLANPQKKMLLLGLHPQLNTLNTRAVTPQMEDPIIQVTKEEKEEEQKTYEQRLQQKSKEIQQYLDSIHQQLKDNVQQVSSNQIKIVKNIKDYIMEAGDSGPVKKFQDLIDQILNTFSSTHGQSKQQEQKQINNKKESQNESDQEHEKQSDKERLQQQELQSQVEHLQQNDSLNRFSKSVELKQQKGNDDSDDKSNGIKYIESFMRKNGIKILDNLQNEPYRFTKQSKKNVKQLLEDQLKLQEQMKENEKQIKQILSEQKQTKPDRSSKKSNRRR